MYIHLCMSVCRYARISYKMKIFKKFQKIENIFSLQAGLGENIYDEDGCFNVQDYYTVYMKITHKQVYVLCCWSTNNYEEIIMIGVLMETPMDVSLETRRFSLETPRFSLETPRFSLKTPYFRWRCPYFCLKPR